MSEYKCKEGMIDNRMVKENHQGGIERVMQRPGDLKKTEGRDGKMGMNRTRESHWDRKGDALTPRKA